MNSISLGEFLTYMYLYLRKNCWLIAGRIHTIEKVDTMKTDILNNNVWVSTYLKIGGQLEGNRIMFYVEIK